MSKASTLGDVKVTSWWLAHQNSSRSTALTAGLSHLQWSGLKIWMQLGEDWRKDEVKMGHTNYVTVEGKCQAQYSGGEYLRPLEVRVEGTINDVFVPRSSIATWVKQQLHWLSDLLLSLSFPCMHYETLKLMWLWLVWKYFVKPGAINGSSWKWTYI